MAGGEQHVVKAYALLGKDVGMTHAGEIVDLTAQKIADARLFLRLAENGAQVQEPSHSLVLGIAVLPQHILGVDVIRDTDDANTLVLAVGNIGRGRRVAGGAERFVGVNVKVAEKKIERHGDLLARIEMDFFYYTTKLQISKVRNPYFLKFSDGCHDNREKET
jgi:hypothetical protein